MIRIVEIEPLQLTNFELELIEMTDEQLDAFATDAARIASGESAAPAPSVPAVSPPIAA